MNAQPKKQTTFNVNSETPKFGLLERALRKLLKGEDITPQIRNTAQINGVDVRRLYIESVRKYPWAVGTALISVIVANVAALFTPLLFKHFFDILNAGNSAVARPELVRTLLMILLVNFIFWACYRAALFSMGHLASRVIADLSQRAFHHLVGHSHNFFTSTFTGALVQKLNRFANGYDRIADRIVFDIIPIAITTTGAVFIVSRESMLLALIILFWAALFMVCNYFFARWKVRYDLVRSSQNSKTGGVLADIISNHPAVEAHGSYAFERGRYAKETLRSADVSRFSWNLSSFLDSFQALTIVLVEFAIFYVSIGYWEKELITLGTFVLIQAYVIQVTHRLWSFSRIIRDLYESFADAKEMAEIMLRPHEIAQNEDAKTLIAEKGKIKFTNVTFGFGDNPPVISDLSLTIAPGERIALVGPSGAGKTTFVKLLMRFYDPKEGAVLIDDQRINDVDIVSLRNALALVPQDPSLFHRSLLENIRYGRPDATDDEVIAAARLANCDEFISVLPLGYETLVGERGVKLSGGERQRVAIARAFLRNAPILILDEATSSLDSESEGYIQDALLRLMQGRTTIVIAHRLSTIRHMDRIVVMEEGKISEDGTHEKLIKGGGKYSLLWSLQQGGFLQDEGVVVEG
jgi:ATP-binding cassette subfamily B protein